MIATHGRMHGPGRFVPALLTLAVLTGLALVSLPESLLLTATVLALLLLPCLVSSRAALLPLLILAPMHVLIQTEVGPVLPLDIGQVLFFVWLFAWSLHHVALRQRLPILTLPTVVILVLIFLLVAGISLFNAVSVAAWLREWLKWLSIALVIFIVGNSMQVRAWRWPVRALLLAGAVNATVGLYQFFGGSGALHFLVGGRFFRAFGTFGQPNPLGGFMALLLPLALCLLLAELKRWLRTRRKASLLSLCAWALPTALLLAGLVASWSRGAWLAFLVAMLVTLLALPRRFVHGLQLAGGVLILTALLWSTGVLPASLGERLASSTEGYLGFEDMRGANINPGNYAVVERLAHWQAALNMASAHPWTGVGLGNYEHTYAQHRLIDWPEALGHAHNYWLNQLAETGLTGLAAWCFMWLAIVLFTLRARQHPDDEARLVVVGLLGAWTSLAVHSLFDNLFVNNLFLHVGFLLGVLAVLHRQACEFKSMPVTLVRQ
ncbi:MAG: O-antigen ligase family protein [Anaerolineaceae bacterium]|nr:O-antigen ligase family protein [Anaerolineaceae bacterium]